MNPLTEFVKNVTSVAVEMQMVDTVTTLQCFTLTPRFSCSTPLDGSLQSA